MRSVERARGPASRALSAALALAIAIGAAGAGATLGCRAAPSPSPSPSRSRSKDAPAGDAPMSREDEADARRARIARLEAEIAATEAPDVAPAYRAWREAANAQRSYRCTPDLDCIGDDFVGYDVEVLRPFSGPAVLRDRPHDRGPLQVLVDFARQLRAHDVDLLVLVVPLKTMVAPERVGPLPVDARGQPLRPDAELRRFYLALEQNGVEVVDLLDAFVAHGHDVIDDDGTPRPEKLFREQDPHWTSHGASVAADVLAARIRRYPWFAPIAHEKGRAVTFERVVWIDAHGDIDHLAGFLGTDAGTANQNAPLEHIPLHQIFVRGETVRAAPMYDRTSPILLVGDSFASEASILGWRSGLPEHLLRALGFRIDVVAVPRGALSTARAAVALTRRGLPGKRLVILEMTGAAFHYGSEWNFVDVYGAPDAGMGDEVR